MFREGFREGFVEGSGFGAEERTGLRVACLSLGVGGWVFRVKGAGIRRLGRVGGFADRGALGF